MDYAVKAYPKESIQLMFSVVVNEQLIVTQYTAHALATNPAAGYGKIEVTVYDSEGNIASDADGQLLDHIPARCYAATGGTFYLTIYAGMLDADNYTAHGWYAVDDGASDALGWRGFSIPGFTVLELAVQATPPTIP